MTAYLLAIVMAAAAPVPAVASVVPAHDATMSGARQQATSDSRADTGRAADAMQDMDMPGMDMGPHAPHAMAAGALGNYPMERDASGTSWQPDASVHAGRHAVRGDWSLMGHLQLNGVADRQSGPRGGSRAFVAGMAMGSARRALGDRDTLQFRAMLSPEPLMGRAGYPLLLATGETADGATALVDRQHPHDLFVELSATWSRRLADRASVFAYAGLPGEPAFGPPAFMHRLSSMDSPEAPITHHWLDSTHVTFGVLTAGIVRGDWKAELSRFHGREPDQHRYDIETGALDSSSARLSWNPAPHWSLQASWARVAGPEQLAPDERQTKWSASAIHTRRLGDAGWWSTTLAWGRRDSDGKWLDAFAVESALKPTADWTFFGRVERARNDELITTAGHHGAAASVAKLSIGAIRDVRVAPHVVLGVGALFAWNAIPGELQPAYGDDPHGAMVFARMKVD